jgi:hypothetical protein
MVFQELLIFCCGERQRKERSICIHMTYTYIYMDKSQAVARRVKVDLEPGSLRTRGQTYDLPHDLPQQRSSDALRLEVVVVVVDVLQV